MENPFKTIRKKMNLSVIDFAMFFDMNPLIIYYLERGGYKKPPKKLLNGLKEYGYNPDELVEEYKSYKEEVKSEIKRRINENNK